MLKVFIIIMMIASLCCSAYGQGTESGSVSGIVTDSQTKMPLFGVKVEMAKDGFLMGISALTDENGRFTIKDFVTDSDLKVSKARYLPKVVNVKEGENTGNISISLELITLIKAGDPERDFSLSSTTGAMVSLADLKEKSIVMIGIGNPYT